MAGQYRLKNNNIEKVIVEGKHVKLNKRLQKHIIIPFSHAWAGEYGLLLRKQQARALPFWNKLTTSALTSY